MTYSGATGTIGAANIFATTPATFAGWPADVYRLKDISMTINGVTYNHTSYTTLETAGNYSVVATFVADGATVAPTSVSPVSHISSGTQVKHTDTGSSTYTSLAPIPVTSNNLYLSANTSPTILPSGGNSTTTVTLYNTGSVASSLDDITVSLPSTPATPTYNTGSSTYNGVAISDPVISGTNIVFVGN